MVRTPAACRCSATIGTRSSGARYVGLPSGAPRSSASALVDEGPAPAVDGGETGQRPGRRRKGVLEHAPLGRPRIQRRGCRPIIAVQAQMVSAECVDDDQNYRAGRWAAAGHREQQCDTEGEPAQMSIGSGRRRDITSHNQNLTGASSGSGHRSSLPLNGSDLPGFFGPPMTGE